MNPSSVSASGLDMTALQSWTGRTEIAHDLATARLIASLLATFESEKNFPSSAAQPDRQVRQAVEFFGIVPSK